MINFWTSKCPPCKEEMPDFEDVYQEMKDKVQFIMVDSVGCMGRQRNPAGLMWKSRDLLFRYTMIWKWTGC